MADDKSDVVLDNLNTKNGNFVCGVVEGFYGRPWTTEQRKDLFAKLRKWGMDSYLYAPKDDCKHRTYWRELYTVEEADHLTGLIAAAKENSIAFYYAISPGLDITYSSPKEIASLKRKLEQVSQFGCQAFALLFDDIEPEMSESDKEVYQSFAHAQVSVTNEVFQHLNQPKFLFCPTQYCGTRAMPNIQNSEYLNTIGSKLALDIDIMWTGSKVISKVLSTESIEEVTEVLKRPPVIWDNLHANDYDQKRLFLGPYSGRTPDLIQKLRGVLTNPNCEYWANYIAIHTLAQWSRCNVDGKRDLSINDSVSADIKLETENEDGSVEDVPSTLSPNMYHPKRALKVAISEWLAEFKKPRSVWGPITKPQIVASPMPIIPSVNTCMSATMTTSSGTGGCVLSAPGINMNQMQQSTTHTQDNDSRMHPVPGGVMNSLVTESKVINDEMCHSSVPDGGPSIDNSSSTGNSVPEPMDCNPTPGSSPSHQVEPLKLESDRTDDVDSNKISVDEVPIVQNSETSVVDSGSSEVRVVNNIACTENVALASNSNCTGMIVESPRSDSSENELCHEDLALLCDLFYLPFEHGSQGLQLLQEFNWLKMNIHLAKQQNGKGKPMKPEVQEWYDRASKFEEMSKALNRLFKRLTYVNNRELLYDLYPYVWDMRVVVSSLNSYIKWLALGCVSQQVTNYIQGTYTWFSKGWKEAFMSGDQEPWIFRGGLTADLQRLIPVDSGNDLFIYKAPDVPTSKIYTIRPYLPSDEQQVYTVCRKTCDDGMDGTEIFLDYPDLIGDKLVGGFLNLSSELCFVAEDEKGVLGYALAALDKKQFDKKCETVWIPEMCRKYPKHKEDGESLASAEIIRGFHNFKPFTPETVYANFPSVMRVNLLTSVIDQSLAKRLVTCLLAALRANGSFGCFVEVNIHDKYLIEFYGKVGFLEVYSSAGTGEEYVYLARAF